MAKTIKPSKAKSEVATKRVRVGGRFVSTDPKALAQKKEELTRQAAAMESLQEDFITPEAKEAIGDDSYEFLKYAMMHAKTYYEGAKYAKEILSRQHPALQNVQSQQEAETPTRVLRWSWEDDPSTESEVKATEETEVPPKPQPQPELEEETNG